MQRFDGHWANSEGARVTTDTQTPRLDLVAPGAVEITIGGGFRYNSPGDGVITAS